MTFSSDKSKRKRKKKSTDRRQPTRLVILLLLILVAVLVYLYIAQTNINNIPLDFFNPPDGDPFTPLCEFESNPHIYVTNYEYPYIIDGNRGSILKLPPRFDIIPWDDGSPYIWGKSQQQVQMVNLNTNTVKSIDNNKSYNYWYNSPSKRYVLMLGQTESNVRNLIIYDNESQTVAIETQTPNIEAYWTPKDSSVLLFNQKANALAQIFDIETLTFSDANLPSDIYKMLGWVDETTVLYLTSAGYLRQWDRTTGGIELFTSERFDHEYRAGSIQYSPNLKYHLNWKQWIGGIDTENNLHMMHVYDPDQHHIVPLNMSQKFNFSIEDQYLLIEFVADSKSYRFYYPDTATQVDFTPLQENGYSIASDGKYIFYYPTDKQSNFLIQEIATSDTFALEEKINGQLKWVDIEDQSYILYSVAIDNGIYVSYLFQPDTKERCKVGTFYTDQISILT